MKKLSPVPKYHVMVKQRVASAVNGLVVPVLYLQRKDGNIFIHEQFHQYMLANPNSSLSWKITRARALGLFWDFSQSIEKMVITSEPVNMYRTTLRLFCQALHFGTIDIDTKLDPLSLYWPSTPIGRAKVLISGLQDFISWVFNDSAGTGNPFDVSSLKNCSDNDISVYPQDSITSTRFLIVANKLKNVSFFSHLKSIKAEAKRLQFAAENKIYNFGYNTNQFISDPAIYMHPDLIAAMLEHGFVRDSTAKIPEYRENITAKMIFLLLSFGGCRVSEPFHLWYNDIILVVNNRCDVFLRHPELAETHIHGEHGTRQQYLAGIGMLPRNIDNISRAYHAGWKNLSTDKSHNARIFWLADGAEALFTSLYINYLNYRRRLMDQRVQRGLPEHPFLFVSAGEDRNSGISKVGDPYSMKAFSKEWDKALVRVSKVLERQIIKSKENGTTEHAPRHFYGQTLSNASADPKIIQKGLRQRSILSQGAYTQPDFNRINSELQTARGKINAGQSGLDFSRINLALANNLETS